MKPSVAVAVTVVTVTAATAVVEINHVEIEPYYRGNKVRLLPQPWCHRGFRGTTTVVETVSLSTMCKRPWLYGIYNVAIRKYVI